MYYWCNICAAYKPVLHLQSLGHNYFFSCLFWTALLPHQPHHMQQLSFTPVTSFNGYNVVRCWGQSYLHTACVWQYNYFMLKQVYQVSYKATCFISAHNTQSPATSLWSLLNSTSFLSPAIFSLSAGGNEAVQGGEPHLEELTLKYLVLP